MFCCIILVRTIFFFQRVAGFGYIWGGGGGGGTESPENTAQGNTSHTRSLFWGRFKKQGLAGFGRDMVLVRGVCAPELGPCGVHNLGILGWICEPLSYRVDTLSSFVALRPSYLINLICYMSPDPWTHLRSRICGHNPWQSVNWAQRGTPSKRSLTKKNWAQRGGRRPKLGSSGAFGPF